MQRLVIAYPKLSQSDFDWIQSVRESHDPKYFDVVAPHVTLVFGTQKLSVSELTDHVHEVVADTQAINLRFDAAQVVEDDSGTFFHAFLVPSQGHRQIIQLHDALYAGPLQSELRHDIPFIPHIGIGTSAAESDMTSLADHITSQRITIKATIDGLDIVEYDGHKVFDRAQVPLSGST